MIETQHDEGRREGVFLYAPQGELEKEMPFHLVGAGCDFYQYPVDRPFGYPDFQWIQSISGEGVFTVEGRDYAVPTGSGILLYPNVAHSYRSAGGDWYVHWITFNGYHIESMLHYFTMKTSGVYAMSSQTPLEADVRKALSLLSAVNEMTGLEGSLIIYRLLIDLFKYVKNRRNESHDHNFRRIEKVFTYIDTHIGKQITIDELSQLAGVTSPYFCEIFKEVTHQRPTEYLNQKRIAKAKELMVSHPNRKFTEIASQVGFTSLSYFTTVFKKLEGMSPGTYRRML